MGKKKKKELELPPSIFESSKKDEGCWDSGIQVAKACSFDTYFPYVDIKDIVRNKVEAMNTRMGSTEWLGYLIGYKSEEEEDVFVIEDVVIPRQKVSGASVEVIDNRLWKGTIGTVHWHHNMGAFHSSTDHDYIGSNWDVTIVTSRQEWHAKVRYTLPCGLIKIVEAEVAFVNANSDAIRTFVDEGVKLIEPEVSRTIVTGGLYQDVKENLSIPGYRFIKGYGQVSLSIAKNWDEQKSWPEYIRRIAKGTNTFYEDLIYLEKEGVYATVSEADKFREDDQKIKVITGHESDADDRKIKVITKPECYVTRNWPKSWFE